ncbi:uncharacterized protein LOC142345009 [Convolutriloba macropyga]|uniref:uncharacterized protein LOC142345009 n=1 Tax=Convolutriloba macropyga TaxID=536237 RepID=UPI003F52416B
MGLDTSALVYMLLIAIGDSISVFIDGVLNIALAHWDVAVLLSKTDFSCKVGQWISYLTTFGTQLVLVLFTFDRLMAVVKPIYYNLKLKANLWYPVKASSAIYILISFLLAGNLYAFALEGGSCLMGSHLSPLMRNLYTLYTGTFLYSVLPGTLILVFNVVIIVNLRKRNSVGSSGTGGGSNRDQSITRGLLSVSFCYLVLTSLGSANILFLTSYVQPRISDDDPKWGKIGTYFL